MADLGYLEQQAGNAEAALDWYRRAWDSAQGPATRQQWGVNYLAALVAMEPEATGAIGETGRLLLTELGEQADGLHQRNVREVARLSNLLLDWAQGTPEDGSRQQVLQSLRAQMDEVCRGLAEQPETCNSFLRASPASG